MKKFTTTQEDKEFTSAVHRIMRMNKTNLTKVCESTGRDYGEVYRKIHSEKIDVKFMEKLIKDIDKNVVFTANYSVTLVKNGKIIYQKTKQNG